MTAYIPTRQAPLGSGLGRDTTADAVLAGMDLTGRLAIVTGGYSGIGLAVVQALAGAGATVIVPARRPDHARDQLKGIGRAEVDELDLADLGSVHGFAARFVSSGRPVDFLINNAAIMATPETRVGPGWEAQLATDHLGHFALTNLLWPALAAGPARVISVSSRGHKASPIQWDDLQFERGYDKWKAYGQAKTANVLFAVQLDRLGFSRGVRAFSVYPGGVQSPLQRHLGHAEMVRLGWFDEQGRSVFPWKTAAQGAATEVWAATSPQLDGLGGVYCEDCDITRVADPSTEEGRQRGVNEWAIDPGQAARLWTLSAELTGTNAFASVA